MDIYGRIQGVPPSTPSRRQHQRYSSADFDINANERAAVRSQYPSTRLSLPSPGSRASPQSLPPQHQRRQAGHPPVPPHYVTPTRARHPSTSAQQARAVRVDPEQWESLRSKGFVLKGSGDVQRSSVTFAPALSVIPSQTSSASSAYPAIDTFPLVRRAPVPSFQVHPSLRTGYHPGAGPGHARPTNPFMKTPLESVRPLRQPVLYPPASKPTVKFDPVDVALVPGQSTSFQQAITFHASSFTPDPIYRAQYLAQPNNQPIHTWPHGHHAQMQQRYEERPRQPHYGQAVQRQGQAQPRVPPQTQSQSQPQRKQTYQRSSRDQPVRSMRAVNHVEFSDIPQIFSRPASPDLVSALVSDQTGCFRSSTLRRQETDQSSYSQATLPETYLSTGTSIQAQGSTPMMLSDWKPLSVDTARSSSQDARSLWLDLERALLGTPELGSLEATTPTVTTLLNDLTFEGRDGVTPATGETTYDFREDGGKTDGGSGAEEEDDLKGSLVRPRLVRRDRTKDRLDHHRALGSSIIGKAQESAAASGEKVSQQVASRSPSRITADMLEQELPARHVRIDLTEEIIGGDLQPKKLTPTPSKIPTAGSSIRRTSRIPVPTVRHGRGKLVDRKANSKCTALRQ